MAWPKELDVRSCDYLEDGAIRVTSMDQYGSLVLSGHKQDFTVCYLSATSEDQPKKAYPNSVYEKEEKKQTNDRIQAYGEEQDRNNSPDENSEIIVTENLSISPISRTSNDSPSQRNENVQEFQRYSTPTREFGAEEVPVVTPYGKTAVFKIAEQSNKISKVSKTDSEPPNESSDKITDIVDNLEPGLSDLDIPKGYKYETVKNVDNLKTRHSYMWVTKHYSCSEHPVCWNHPISLAKQAGEEQNKHSQNGWYSNCMYLA